MKLLFTVQLSTASVTTDQSEEPEIKPYGCRVMLAGKRWTAASAWDIRPAKWT